MTPLHFSETRLQISVLIVAGNLLDEYAPLVE
jgi:hypothetical protein